MDQPITPLTPPDQPNPSLSASGSKPGQVTGCLDFAVMMILSIGTAMVVFIRHFSTLGTTIAPDGAPWIAALIGIGVQFVVLSPFLILLAIFWQSPTRKTYQAWLIAHILTMFLAAGFFLPFTAIYLQAVFQIIVGLVLLLVLIPIHHWFSKIRMEQPIPAPQISDSSAARPPIPALLWLSAGIVVVFSVIPWLLHGAFGSPLDTVLMTLVGLINGLIAALVFQLFFRQKGASNKPAPASSDLLDGLGFSIFLLLLASSMSFCFGGVQLLAMISLPFLGGLVVLITSILSPNRSTGAEQPGWRLVLEKALPIGVMIGFVLSYPLVFFDPDELVLVLSASAGEVLTQAFQAAFYTALILIFFLFFTLLIRALRKKPSIESLDHNYSPRSTWLQIPLALLLVFGIALGLFLYLTRGQPGFYGDRYFVVLKEQADLTDIRRIHDYKERRWQAYTRLVAHADRSQAAIRKSLDRFSIDYTPYYLVNGLDVQGSVLVKLWLQTRPEVDRILENPILRPLPSPIPSQGGMIDTPPETLWNLELIQADRVWKEFGVRGQGIIIGQSDSGVQGDHPELADSYRGRFGSNDYNWLDPWNHTSAPVDIGGHGTHTLGTIVGNATGVAPDAEWIACVNLARNLGNPALYLDCMQFSFAPYPQAGDPLRDGDPGRGAHVLNNSWGCPKIEGCDSETFHPAVSALRDAGVFVVGSAGNDGPKCGSLNVPPPTYAEVFAVGAIDASGELASFSSIGSTNPEQSGLIKPDLVAPGVQVLSSLPKSSYGQFSGTSMAGPHVVGVVALMWSANPDLIGDIQTTEQILIASAEPYSGALPDCPGADQLPSTAAGYGIVNAYHAVQMAIEK